MVTGNDAAAKHSPAELQRARVAYEQAVKADPRYAPAYGALANTLAELAALAVEPPKSLLPVADAYARRAIELDPNHPLGWSALAQAHVQWTRNWVGAEAGFRRALDLAPDTQSAASLLAQLLAARHRPTEAVEQSLKALQLDRESPALQTSAGIVHELAGRSAEALPYFERALKQDPAYATAAIWQSATLARLGRFDDALAAAQQARAAMQNAPVWVEGYVHALAGRDGDARAVLAGAAGSRPAAIRSGHRVRVPPPRPRRAGRGPDLAGRGRRGTESRDGSPGRRPEGGRRCEVTRASRLSCRR